MRSSRVCVTSALADELTATSPSQQPAACPSDSVSYARYWLANSVSPPYGGTSRASSIEPIGGSSRYVVSECQMPPKLWRSCSSFFTSITSGNPSMPLTNGYSIGSPMRRAKAMNWAGIELLVAEEDDLVLEKGLSNFLFGKILRQVDAEDLGAERARDASDFQRLLDLDVRVLDDRAVALLLAGCMNAAISSGVLDTASRPSVTMRSLSSSLAAPSGSPGEARDELARRAGRRGVADPGARCRSRGRSAASASGGTSGSAAGAARWRRRSASARPDLMCGAVAATVSSV